MLHDMSMTRLIHRNEYQRLQQQVVARPSHAPVLGAGDPAHDRCSCPATHRGRTHGCRCGCRSCHRGMASRWTPRERPVATQACAMLRRLHWHLPTGPRIRVHAALQCVSVCCGGLQTVWMHARDRAHRRGRSLLQSCQPAYTSSAELLLTHAPSSVTIETSLDIHACQRCCSSDTERHWGGSPGHPGSVAPALRCSHPVDDCLPGGARSARIVSDSMALLFAQRTPGVQRAPPGMRCSLRLPGSAE